MVSKKSQRLDLELSKSDKIKENNGKWRDFLKRIIPVTARCDTFVTSGRRLVRWYTVRFVQAGST